MLKLNPNGCIGGFHGCSLVQTVAILSIVLQHPSKRCKNLKKQLRKEIKSYESAWAIYDLPENKSVESIRYNLLKVILNEMIDYKGKCQPDITPIWEVMNSHFPEGSYLNRIFSDFTNVNNSKDLKKTMDPILDILFNCENGHVKKKTDNLWGLCLGEAERYLRCSNAGCRKLTFESASRFPFLMAYEPPFVSNFEVPMEKVIRNIIETHVDSVLTPPIKEDKKRCPWERCGEMAFDAFACDTELPAFFIAQINFLENVEKSAQALITENKIISVKGVLYAVVAKVAHLGNETSEGHYIMDIAEDGGNMVTLNNANFGNSKPQSISRNDAYFICLKVENNGNPPPFPFFNTSQREDSPMEVDSSEDISEAEDVEMKDSLDFSDAYTLQKWFKDRPNWEPMPNALIENIRDKLEEVSQMETLNIEDAINSFFQIYENSLFSEKFRTDLKESIIKYMPRYLQGGGLEISNWETHIFQAFVEFDRNFFPQMQPFPKWRKPYKRFHKNLRDNVIPEIIERSDVLSDNRVQSIEASMIKCETSLENRERVRIIMDSLREDAVETYFGNICFRNATDDRLKLHTACHLTFSKCQRLERLEKGTACLMSAAKNKMQGIIYFVFFFSKKHIQKIDTLSYSLLSKEVMENEILGVKLKTFNQIIDFLVFNELKSAHVLAKVAGLSDDFTIPRELRKKKKKKKSKDKREETDEEMPDISEKRKAKNKSKSNKNEDSAWLPPGGWNKSQKDEENTFTVYYPLLYHIFSLFLHIIYHSFP